MVYKGRREEMDPDKDKRQRFVYLVSPENILGAVLEINSAEEARVDLDVEEAFGNKD